MASSKKTKEEKEKRKSTAQAEGTKSRKPETKKKAKPSPKKLIKDRKNAGIQNGTVSESEEEVVEITPASSINDSQEEDSGSEEDSGFQEQEAANGREKIKRPKKNGKEIEQEDDDDDEEEDHDEREESIVCNFPMARIKRIMKTQTSDLAITGEAVFLVNKATDKFLEQFCEDAYESCAKDRKKTIAYNHLASVVSKQRRYDFLTDFVPEKIKAEDALEQRKLAEAAEA